MAGELMTDGVLAGVVSGGEAPSSQEAERPYTSVWLLPRPLPG